MAIFKRTKVQKLVISFTEESEGGTRYLKTDVDGELTDMMRNSLLEMALEGKNIKHIHVGF